jgi:Rieske Fe-S protein
LAIQAFIVGIVSVVVGGAIISPVFRRRQETWLAAGKLTELIENRPVPVTLRVAREDGYVDVIERHTVFLVRTGTAAVLALDATCTHLGCRVSWDADTRELKCPCHGGIYDAMGRVKAGPPPAPLRRLPIRIEGHEVEVQV